jgi:hypothetical protein
MHATVKQVRDAASRWQDRPVLRPAADASDVEAVTIRYLMYVLMPAWFIPGFADYLIHRRTKIESTSGVRESAIHSLMMGEIAIPVTLTLLFETNAAVLAAAAAATGVHEATAIWDVRAAVNGGREVPPVEQHLHSFLESLPIMATAALCCLHWDQVAKLRTKAGRRESGRLRLRRHPLPPGYLAAVAAGVACLIAAPYGEELWRCVRAGRRQLGV